jgi:hypothetical protein
MMLWAKKNKRFIERAHAQVTRREIKSREENQQTLL